jgi:uncharacterized membrane protein
VIQFTASLLLVLPLAVIFEGLGPDFAAVHWTPRFIGALLWSVLGLSIGAIFLLFALIRRNDATQVTSLMYLTPPTTAIMAWLMFGEAFNALGIAGMALAVTGVILWSRNLKKRDRMISSPSQQPLTLPLPRAAPSALFCRRRWRTRTSQILQVPAARHPAPTPSHGKCMCCGRAQAAARPPFWPPITIRLAPSTRKNMPTTRGVGLALHRPAPQGRLGPVRAAGPDARQQGRHGGPAWPQL